MNIIFLHCHPKLILALLIITGICFIAFGILFIWYKRKTTLTASTVGNISKLIPSLTEKKPSLNSLLPILSELQFSINNKNTNNDTTTAVSQKSPSTSDEQSLPIMVPCHHTKLIKAKMATPLTSTTTKTELEPISLELFNHAAVDLDKRVRLNLNVIRNIYLIETDQE